jgi:hypothetical protein
MTGKPVTDGYVQVAVDGAGKKLDNSVVTVDGQIVYRERVNVADPSEAENIAKVQDFTIGLEQGLITRDPYAREMLNAINYLTEEIRMLRMVMELHVGIKGD